MKIISTLATASILAALSFGASAATMVSAEQAANMQSVGTISVSGIDGVPSDINQRLSDKADSAGAKSFHIIEAHNDGSYHVTAELFN